jgi:DNA-binding CsgD family transcriptional regulator
MRVPLKICLVTKDTPFSRGLKLFYQDKPSILLTVSENSALSDIYDVIVFDLDSAMGINNSLISKTIFVSDEKKGFRNFNIVAKKLSPFELNNEIVLASQSPGRIGDANAKFNDVTLRESEILYHLSEGLSTKEIANICAVSVGTINAHRLSIIQKYGAKNTANLIYTVLKKLKE